MLKFKTHTQLFPAIVDAPIAVCANAVIFSRSMAKIFAISVRPGHTVMTRDVVRVSNARPEVKHLTMANTNARLANLVTTRAYQALPYANCVHAVIST
jgi:hypothetical protein